MTVLTCPLRREYFASTMASVRKAGGDRFEGPKVVFVDGGSDLTAEEWAWYKEIAGPWWDVRSTNGYAKTDNPFLETKNAMLAILHAAADDGASYLIYMEDDIVLCKNAIDALSKVRVHDHIAFYTFCDIKNVATLSGVTEYAGYDFLAPAGEGGHWGNQLLLIPGRSLRYLRKTTVLPNWTTTLKNLGPNWMHGPAQLAEEKRASDILLGLSLACEPAPWRAYGVFTPSLAQHVGERSLVNPVATLGRWGRDTLTWPGEDFDALTLDLECSQVHEGVPDHRIDGKTRLQRRFRPMRPKK